MDALNGFMIILPLIIQ